MMLKKSVLICFCWIACHATAQLDSLVLKHLAAQRIYKTQADAVTVAPSDNYDWNAVSLHLFIHPAQTYLRGYATQYFTPLQPLQRIAFDLHNGLTADSVSHPLLQNFSHSDHHLIIHFSQPISTFDSLKIFYHGTPSTSGFGSVSSDTTKENKPIFWTLSEPYGARDWFPCKMTLQDKADSVFLHIATISPNKVAANGVLNAITTNRDTVTYHYSSRYPMANYLIGIVVYDFVSVDDTFYFSDYRLPVQNFCFAADSADWRSAMPTLRSFIVLFDSLFGQYPFSNEKYGHMQFPWGGGMEHQTMSSMYNLSYELTAHELAHQWFGDKITCASWQDIWLNEGFATYLSGLCYENLSPYWWMPFLEGTATRATRDESLSIVFADTTDTRRIFNSNISYSKAAYALHMLRWTMGDRLFFQAIRNYINDTALAYRFAATPHLQAHLEAVWGKSLQTFFEQWIYAGGYATYHLDWIAGNTLRLKLSQDTHHPTTDFFEIGLPVQIYTDKTDTTVVLFPTAKESFFEVDFAKSGIVAAGEKIRIDSIKIDEKRWILSKGNTVRRVPSFDEFGITVYPNPASDKLTVWLDGNVIQKVNYTLYSSAGARIKTDYAAVSGDWFDINVADLADGIYHLQLSSEAATKSFKIVIER